LGIMAALKRHRTRKTTGATEESKKKESGERRIAKRKSRDNSCTKLFGNITAQHGGASRCSGKTKISSGRPRGHLRRKKQSGRETYAMATINSDRW